MKNIFKKYFLLLGKIISVLLLVNLLAVVIDMGKSIQNEEIMILIMTLLYFTLYTFVIIKKNEVVFKASEPFQYLFDFLFYISFVILILSLLIYPLALIQAQWNYGLYFFFWFAFFMVNIEINDHKN